MMRCSNHFLSAVINFSELHPIVTTLIEEHTQVRDELSSLLRRTQDSRSTLQVSQSDRRSLIDEVKAHLESLFYDLRGAESSGTFNFTRFFPNRKVGDIGRSIADRRAALQRCLEGLELYPDAPDAAGWKQRLGELQAEFDPAVNSVSTQDTTKRSDSAELRRIRSNWKFGYLASKKIMEGLLIRARRQEEYHSLFYDLQQSQPVSSNNSAESVSKEADQPTSGE